MSVVTGSPVDSFTRRRMASPRSKPGPRYAVDAGAIGLVERGLEHQRHGQFGGDLLQPRGNRERQLLALDHARPGDDQQRLAAAAAKISDGDGIFGHEKRNDEV